MMIATARKVPLLDLQAQHATIREEAVSALLRVVDSQKFILGEEVDSLESELAPYCGAAHAVGCASGSDALLLALIARDDIGMPPHMIREDALIAASVMVAIVAAISWRKPKQRL